MYLHRVRLAADPDELDLPGYVRALPAVRALAGPGLEFRSAITVLVGDNGAGKSTLLEALAVGLGLGAEGGSQYVRANPGAPEVSPLHEHLIFTRGRNPRHRFFLRGESYLDLANYYRGLGPNQDLFGLTERSHGQGLKELIAKRFTREGLYFLDEPEDGLSMFAQLEVAGQLSLAAQRGAQIIVATHSPIFAALADAAVLHVGPTGLVDTAYDRIEAVAAAREFLEDPVGTLEFVTQAGAPAPRPAKSYVRWVWGRAVSKVQPWVKEIPAIADVLGRREEDALDIGAPIVVITGENGTGKSTLLGAIAGAYGFSDNGGPWGVPMTRTSRPALRDGIHLGLGNQPKDGYYLRADAHYAMSNELGAAFAEQNLHAMSHGESVRAIVGRGFDGRGLYLLDEPESGLSLVTQLAICAEIVHCAAAGAQFIIVTHSPVFAALPEVLERLTGTPGLLYDFSTDADAPTTRRAGVEQTLCFRALRDFLADPHGIMDFMVEVAESAERS